MSNISAVIIDDEVANCQLINSLINQLNNSYTVLGSAGGVIAGHKLIVELNPDVVFLDIRMKDGSGFDLLNMFERISFEVVFITGFDEYALKAFDHQALDYILKPISVVKFSQTLQKVESRIMKTTEYFEKLKTSVEHPDPPGSIAKILIHQNDKVVLVDLLETMYVRCIEGCTYFHKSISEKFVTGKQLHTFDSVLENLSSYIKINKSTYLNVNFIESYSKGFYCTVTMKDETVHEVSRRKKTEIIKTLSLIAKGFKVEEK